MTRLTVRAISESITKYNGNVSAVARSFGVSRKSVYQFCTEKHPELWELIEEQREAWLDDAESELRRQANEDGNTTALIFFLKTQGYKRGYVERKEISGPAGGPVEIALRWADGEADDNAND